MPKTVDERHVINGRLMASEVRVGDGLMLGPHTFRVRIVEPLHIFEVMPQRPPGVSVVEAVRTYDKSYGPHVIKLDGWIEDIDQGRTLTVSTNFVFQLEPSPNAASRGAGAPQRSGEPPRSTLESTATDPNAPNPRP